MVLLMTHDIHSLSRVNTNICWKQSRLLLLKDGDANSKFFHTVLSSHRRRNSIVSFVEDGEGVQPIRNAVFSHFKNYFNEQHKLQPGVENLSFKTLSYMDGGSLIKHFSVEEVKAAVWDCDSFKSPGQDDVNFGFIKELWQVLKEDIMCFITEFHRMENLLEVLRQILLLSFQKLISRRS